MDKEKNKKQKDPLKTPYGDSVVYNLVMSMIGGLIFITIGLILGLFTRQIDKISELFSYAFLEFYITIFFWILIASILGRILAYFLLKPIYESVGYKFGGYKKLTDPKSNRMGMIFLLSSFISAFLFAIGCIFILQSMLFNYQTIWTLFVTFILIKLVVFLLVRTYLQFKV